MEALDKVPCFNVEYPTILFAGDVPWPDIHIIPYREPRDKAVPAIPIPINHYYDQYDLSFQPYDFRRFLGVIWRLTVAHKIRAKFRQRIAGKVDSALATLKVSTENRKPFDMKGWELDVSVPVKTLVAPIPMMSTIVDDRVWVLFPGEEKGDVYQSRGYYLTQTEDSDHKVERYYSDLADTYEELFQRYIRHAHSAREYIESILILASQFIDGLDSSSPLILRNIIINDRVDILTMYDSFYYKILDLLGLRKWSSWEKRLISQPDIQDLGIESIVELETCAVLLLSEYLQILTSANNFRYKTNNQLIRDQYGFTYHDLYEDVI
jgi:hypothetical protein